MKSQPDWKDVKRTGHPISEEEREEIREKLNKYLAQYRSSETIHWMGDLNEGENE